MARRPRSLADRLKTLLCKGHFCVLLGAGASACAGYPLMAALTNKVLGRLPQQDFTLVHDMWESVKGAAGVNIEAVLGKLYSLLDVCDTKPNVARVDRGEVERCLSAVEEEIARPFLVEKDISVHRRLVRRVCDLNSKAPGVVATSNYDLLVERACEAEQVWCLDGFVGSEKRGWSIESLPLWVGTVGERRRFRSHEKSIRLLKLHGSVSWGTDGDQVVAFPGGRIPKGGRWVRRLVYPTPRKVGEGFGEPYSSLLRYFAEVADRPNGLLVTLGFSYRDDHLAEPIKQFVSKPDRTLVALVQRPEGALGDLLEKGNVICIAEDKAWLGGGCSDEKLEIWQLPGLVDFLEGL